MERAKSAAELLTAIRDATNDVHHTNDATADDLGRQNRPDGDLETETATATVSATEIEIEIETVTRIENLSHAGHAMTEALAGADVTTTMTKPTNKSQDEAR